MREGMDSETWVTRESALSMRGPGQPEEEAPSPGGVCELLVVSRSQGAAEGDHARRTHGDGSARRMIVYRSPRC